MTDVSFIRNLCLSFPQTTEDAYFENRAFKVKKKIFLTLNEKESRVTIKLSEMDQAQFSSFDPKNIFHVPNKWGKQGWTHILLEEINTDLLKDAVTIAYCTVAPSKLGAEIRLKHEQQE